LAGEKSAHVVNGARPGTGAKEGKTKSKVNDALEHLRMGKARYRIVLTDDFN
jgi:hypothetical protein